MQTIFAYSAHNASPASAYEALAEIHVRLNTLADQPGLGRAGPIPGTRYRIVRHYAATYRATYRVRGQHVIILRVRDTRRQDA